MRLNEETAVQRAKDDLARRLGVPSSVVKKESVTKTDFPDMSLGAGTAGELAAQLIATGWIIKLSANGQRFEYRADKSHLRLVGFKGKNYVIG